MNNPYLLKVLKRLMPICNLSDDKINELLRKTVLEELPAGEILFTEGISDNKVYYLLTGELELSRTGGGSQVIAGGTKLTLMPLAHRKPRQETAIAKTDIGYVAFDTDYLDALLTLDQTTAGEKVEAEEDEERPRMLPNLLLITGCSANGCFVHEDSCESEVE